MQGNLPDHVFKEIERVAYIRGIDSADRATDLAMHNLKTLEGYSRWVEELVWRGVHSVVMEAYERRNEAIRRELA